MSAKSSAPCSRSDLAAFIAADQPGNRLTYFIAVHDGGYRGLDLTLRWHPTRDLRAVVNRVRSLYNMGLVDLVQDRTVSPDVTHYVAIWRRHQRAVIGPEQLPLVEIVD